MNELSSLRGRRTLCGLIALSAAGTLWSAGASAATPVARDDKFPVDTAIYTRDGAATIPAPGVLVNDTDRDGDALTADPNLVSGPTHGTVTLSPDGSFTYTPNDPSAPQYDSFSYRASDGTTSAEATVDLSVTTGLDVTIGQKQFNILMNYELGMHCTGFEFAYCCVLPPYNSILAQVVKSDKGVNDDDFPHLLEGDPNENKDALDRQTVLRDPALRSGNFRKYVLRYWHEAQPRNDGRGKLQKSRLISAQELNSMFMWNTVFDVAAKNADGSLKRGTYANYQDVPIGDGTYDAGGYANGWLNHLYIYTNPATGGPNLEGLGKTGVDADKIHLGVDVPVPVDCGPALHPLGPVTKNLAGPGTVPNDCGGASKGNLLTYSGETGTIVYTQMRVLEDLPVTLTSPGIWEALGLPLTPLEDTLNFFADPGLVDEDSIRPFVAMKAQLHYYDPSKPQGRGGAVLDEGKPVIGFGTAPIDIPNCERCHSKVQSDVSPNAPNVPGTAEAALVQQEESFWKAYYQLDTAAGDSDWYARLKGAAISILSGHDSSYLTDFLRCYPNVPVDPNDWTQGNVAPPGCTPLDPAPFVQTTRMGHESVICQKCHADNAIGSTRSALFGSFRILPVTEAIHRRHLSVSQGGSIAFADSLGRDGMCQGCHPAHRSNGDMEGYPITEDGNNAYADSDNRLGAGGCFVGRDVHANPMKDVDGAETPEYLNVVGEWLKDKVFRNQGGLAGSDAQVRGLWCTNCHTQLSQEIWKTEDCVDLVRGDCAVNPRGAATIEDLAAMIGATPETVESWMDPKDNASIETETPDGIDHTRDIWRNHYAGGVFADAMMAVIEVDASGTPVNSGLEPNGNFNVNILSLCTTQACLDSINDNKGDPTQWLHPEDGALDGVPGFVDPANQGVAVPFRAADDAGDHWLAAGEPHCADCHAAPYVEQSGNINAFAPFNYPRKAGLMRYSRGHQGITCQGCHESTHGLYPVAPDRDAGPGTPGVDATSYAQAENLNYDGSHGPLKCGSCHAVGANGVPTWFRNSQLLSFDDMVGWAHTYTEEANVLDDVCKNCHDVKGLDWNRVNANRKQWLIHTQLKRVSRQAMDKAELEVQGHVLGVDDGVCEGCHEDKGTVSCSTEWKRHLTRGRVAYSVWEEVSQADTVSTCGW